MYFSTKGWRSAQRWQQGTASHRVQQVWLLEVVKVPNDDET